MTISTAANRVQYAGNGSTADFSVTFPYTAESQIVVVVTSAAGVDSTKTNGVEYELTDPGATGTVSFGVAPTDYRPQTGERVTIYRLPDFLQSDDYIAGGGFSTPILEAALDKVTTQIQHVKTLVDQAPRLGLTSPTTGPLSLPEPDAGKILVWNADEDGFDNQDSPADAVSDAEAAADAAAASALAAAGSASAASTSASTASTAASNAQTAETNAETAETNAEAAQAAAEAAQTAAEAAQAAAEAASENPAFTFLFDDGVNDSDPGAGEFRFNNSTPSLATSLFIDNADDDGNTVSAWLDAWDNSGATTGRGHVLIKGIDAPTAFLVANVTGSIVDGTGYRKATLSVLASGGTFGAGDRFSVLFTPAGATGAAGAGTGDVVGPASSTDNAVARFDSTTGELLQNSTLLLGDTGPLTPAANDGIALGTGSLAFSDLFLASGAVINFNNGGQTITHSGTDLLITGTISIGAADTTLQRASAGNLQVEGNLIYRAGGTDVPVSDGGTGASSASAAATNLGLGTGDTPQFNGINIGATDTTITRDAAGVIAVEGIPVYPSMPQNSQSAAYTLVLADAQKHILHPAADNNARTFTIPANSSVAYPIGTAITFINEINTVTIAITSDTLTLAGAGTTGSRTLAANGVATAIKVTSTKWYISGAGLT